VPPVHRRHAHSSLRPRCFGIVKRFSNRTGTNIRRGFTRCKYLSREKMRAPVRNASTRPDSVSDSTTARVLHHSYSHTHAVFTLFGRVA
jgi:hypothetical protein